MAQKMFTQILTTKTLIRVAFAVISLSGIAHAQSAQKLQLQQGAGHYNFMAGGGG